ncbi:uncharacterized protein LOC120201813 isoform X2 [Hibiscus syriacus]|uniref:uncharacterized protein LOC120201813 isoform X2 n=1 Tax=Hibiscus syriacus TaxID=106335 RepID=UPI001922D374|nr:uncharacterized protein LOC120201813 isoform X2 [Hibiscus syriacus]
MTCFFALKKAIKWGESRAFINIIVSLIFPVSVFSSKEFNLVSFLASTMNSPVAKEDAEKQTGTRPCACYNKVLNKYRALEGHRRINYEGKTLGTLNYLGSSSNSRDTTRSSPALLPNSQRNSSPRVNKLTPFTRIPPSFDPSRVFGSNETNHASMTGFTGGNPGVSPTQSFMFPNYSCGRGSVCHHSSLASGGSAPTGPHTAMSSAAFSQSSIVVTSGFNLDTSLCLGPNEVCQFNTDEFQISRDGLPPTRGNALRNIQGYNLGPPPSSSPDRAGQNDHRSLVICEQGKRPFLDDESRKPDETNASKKPKISSDSHLKPENLVKKELALFVDVDGSVPAPKALFDEAKEGPVDVDLSLHL